MSKFHELAEKLKALAERGVGGEKENAIRMLDDLRRKHGIRPDEIESCARTTCQFPLFQNNPRHTAFVAQCVGSTAAVKPYLVTKGAHHYLEADVTHAERIEIEAKIAFYWAVWLREEKAFFSAFVQVNNLGGLPGGNAKPATPEELAEIRRKAKAMDAQAMHKQLGR